MILGKRIHSNTKELLQNLNVSIIMRIARLLLENHDSYPHCVHLFVMCYVLFDNWLALFATTHVSETGTRYCNAAKWN